MSDSISLAFFVAATFAAAGFVKGVVGMGLPTVAMGILSLTMPPVTAAAILIVPSLVTNVWQLLTGPRLGVLLRRLATMQLMICIGTALSINVLIGTFSSTAGVVLGIILAIYGAYGLVAPQFTVPSRVQPLLAPVIGFSTGLITGATGVFVVPAVPYLSSIGLTKDDLVQALGLSFTVSTVALAMALALSGKYQTISVGTSILATLPALIGMFLGGLVRDKLNPIAFKRIFFAGLVLLGLYMFSRQFLIN